MIRVSRFRRMFAGERQSAQRRIGALPKLPVAGVAFIALFALILSGCQLVKGGSWESLGPERGGNILTITTDPFVSQRVYLGSDNGYVYVARGDTGPNLVPSAGIPKNAAVVALLADPVHKGTVYAGTSAGFFVSTDYAASWEARGAGFPQGDSLTALAYAKDQNILFAGSAAHGVFLSHDQGNTWQASDSGLPGGGNINALLWEPTTQMLYTAVDGVGVFASNNLGASWTERSTGLPKQVYALVDLPKNGINFTGLTLYAGTSQGVFASTNNGDIWSLSGTGLTQPVYSLAIYPTILGWIYAGTNSDVIRSPDGGRTWATVAPGLAHRVLGVASVPGTNPPYVIFAASGNLWRYPPEQGNDSGPLSFIVQAVIFLILLGLLFYFFRRSRRRGNFPLPTITSGGAQRTPGAANQPNQSNGQQRDLAARAAMNGHKPAQPAANRNTTSTRPSGKNSRNSKNGKKKR